MGDPISEYDDAVDRGYESLERDRNSPEMRAAIAGQLDCPNALYGMHSSPNKRGRCDWCGRLEPPFDVPIEDDDD